MNRPSGDHLHPSDQELFLAIEGEMPPHRLSSLRHHVETCWQCQARWTGYRETIEDFMRLHAVQRQHEYDSAAVRFRLTAAMRDRERAAASAFPAMLRWVWERAVSNIGPRVYVTAGLCLAALALVLFHVSGPVPAVSASELIERAVQNQSREPRREQVRIRIAGWQTTREVRRAARKSDTRGSSKAAAAVPQVVLQTLAQAHVALDDPLSASDFRDWRSRLSSRRDRVTPAAGHLTLTTYTEEASLSEASLTVEEGSFRPVRKEMTLESGERVEVEAIAYGPPDLEVSDSRRPAKEIAPQPPAATALPLPPSSLPDPQVLAESEMNVRYELFLNATGRGHVLNIAREPAAIVVTLAAGAEQEQVARSLARIPYVQIETDRQTADAALAGVPVISSSDTGQAGEAGFDRILKEKLPSTGERDRFVREVIAAGQDALENSAALKALGERYGPPEYAQMPERLKARLQEMIQGHLAAIRIGYGTLAQLPEMAAAGELPASRSSFEDWQPRASRLYAVVRKAQERAMWLVTGGTAMPSEPGPLITELQAALAEWKALADAWDGPP